MSGLALSTALEKERQRNATLRREVELLRVTAKQREVMIDELSWALRCLDSSCVQTIAQEAMEGKIHTSEDNHVDLLNDEFERILAITESDEIKGICQRSKLIISQHHPVIKQRNDALSRIRFLEEGVRCAVEALEAVEIQECDLSHPDGCECCISESSMKSIATEALSIIKLLLEVKK